MDNIRGARPHDHPPRLILNGVGMQKRPEISVADFAKTIEVEPIAIIPHDAKLFGSAANNGQMIAEIDPKSRCAEIFAEIAGLIAGRVETRKAEARPVRPAAGQVRRDARRVERPASHRVAFGETTGTPDMFGKRSTPGTAAPSPRRPRRRRVAGGGADRGRTSPNPRQARRIRRPIRNRKAISRPSR